MLILPVANALTKPYWDAAREHQLVIQTCNVCGHRWHPAMPMCSACHAKNYAWTPVVGRGIVYTYTVVHHAVHAAVTDRLPYVIALVELEEGARVVTNIVNCSPERVSIGLPVSLTFEHTAEGIVLPQFEPAAEPSGRTR